MDRRAWWATVYGVTKSRTRLSNFHFSSHSQPDVLTSLLSVHFTLYPDGVHTTPGPQHTPSKPLNTTRTHLLIPACSPTYLCSVGLPASLSSPFRAPAHGRCLTEQW